ncbi:MAG: pantoate--beta-alanine ligase [Holosporales bacterium]
MPDFPPACALIPTMGALHAGHMALVAAAKARGLAPVVSIFVNPKQFGANEDFDRYPRPIEEDDALCRIHNVDTVWRPTVEEVYPSGFATTVHVAPDLTGILCGAYRPGHFDGVATVVSILINTVRPAATFFGEKDYQQLCIIKRLAADLRLPGEIIGVPTVREADGLALSSRNRYLYADERRLAPMLHHVLQQVSGGNMSPEHAKQSLLECGFTKVDYLERRSLEPGVTRVLGAAWLGRTRLIDNVVSGRW